MQIKDEWIAKAREVYWAEDGYEDFDARFRAALSAVAPLIAEEERAECAEIAETTARSISKGTHGRPGSVDEIGDRIAAVIRARGESHD